jgi:hypothetical protein
MISALLHGALDALVCIAVHSFTSFVRDIASMPSLLQTMQKAVTKVTAF